MPYHKNKISGNNRSRKKVAMTARVSQQPMGEKIKMTAPVEQRRVQEKLAVSFMIPASYTVETLPEPKDPNIILRQVPARRMASVRYSGFWSEKRYLRYKLELESWIRERSLTAVGDPISVIVFSERWRPKNMPTKMFPQVVNLLKPT